MSERADPKAIEEQIERLSKVASHPATIAAVEELAALPAEERPDAARRIASPEALRERGVQFPEGDRITISCLAEPAAPVQSEVKLGEVGESPVPEGALEVSGILVCVWIYERWVCIRIGI
jgi:hypothetical protein